MLLCNGNSENDYLLIIYGSTYIVYYSKFAFVKHPFFTFFFEMSVKCFGVTRTIDNSICTTIVLGHRVMVHETLLRLKGIGLEWYSRLQPVRIVCRVFCITLWDFTSKTIKIKNFIQFYNCNVLV